MDCFIKKIFEGSIDDLVHNQFQKFSRGEFKNKAMIIAKKSKNKYTLSTTPEYSNEFVRMLAEKLGDGKAEVKGPIVSTRDLTGELDFQDKKQFAGVKQYVIDREMSGSEMLALLDKLPLSHFGLSFKIDNSELKIKPKMPKSGKPSSKGEAKPKVDFCKLITTNQEIAKNLLFDLPADFKKVFISHDFIINEIIPPKGETDFAKIRELAKRKGKIVRRVVIDEGSEKVSEAEFEA